MNDERIAIVDELGALDAELGPLAGKIKRRESLRHTVASWDQGRGDGEAFVIEGAGYRALVSARDNKSVINKGKLQKLLGAARFRKCAQFTLKTLESFLSASQLESVVALERTGPRHVTTYAVPGKSEAA